MCAMKTNTISIAAIGFILFCSITTAFSFNSQQQPARSSPQYQQNTAPPAQTVRLIFIHHSTGENWLSDDIGQLGIALRDNNYFVSDTNYGWGPQDLDAGYDTIGDHTDLGNWYSWFRGPNSETYLSDLYAESEQHAGYSRLEKNSGGENTVILFKSCFPNSNLQGTPDEPVPSIDSNPLRGQDAYSEYHTVANAKGIYSDLLEYFKTRQDKLFIAITAPPLSDPTNATNARAFNNWLVDEWLADYPHKNVFVFDFYNVLTTNGGNSLVNDLNRSDGNHHRWWNNAVQHKTDGDHDANSNITEYASGFDDDHPNQAGSLKATGEFVPLLNIAYNTWHQTAPTVTTTVPGDTTTTTIAPDDGADDGGPCVLEELYGSQSETVQSLRAYRDNVISRTTGGATAINLYYRFSPAAKAIFESNAYLIELLRLFCPETCERLR